MPRRYPCAGECGTLIWHGAGSLPPGEATCRECRALRPKSSRSKKTAKSPCTSCGEPSWGERCRPCQDQYRRANAVGNPRDSGRRRYARELAAPGLTQTQRYRLRDEWVRLGKRCTYCPALANSIDHVVPLSKGGTHYEGNLVPCCMDCNAKKSDLLLIEWRHGRRLPKWRTEVRLRPASTKPSVPRGSVVKVCKVYFITCGWCGNVATARNPRTLYCSRSCGYLANLRDKRQRYVPEPATRLAACVGVNHIDDDQMALIPSRRRSDLCDCCHAERQRELKRAEVRRYAQRRRNGPPWGVDYSHGRLSGTPQSSSVYS